MKKIILLIPLFLAGCSNSSNNAIRISNHLFKMIDNEQYTMKISADSLTASFTYLYDGTLTEKVREITLTKASKGETSYASYYTDESVGRYGYLLNFTDNGTYNSDSEEFNNFMSYKCNNFRFIVLYNDVKDSPKNSEFYSTGIISSTIDSGGESTVYTVAEFI